MSRARKFLYLVAGVVVLGVGALAVFLFTFDPNQYRGLVLDQLKRSMNRPVEAAELELRLIPLRLRLNQIRIPEHPSFGKNQEFITADAVQVELSVWSLLRGSPELVGLELDRPTIYLRQNAAGQWNLSTLAAPPSPSQAGSRPNQTEALAAGFAPTMEPSAPRSSPAQPPVRNWLLREGTIVIERADQKPIRLTGVEMAASDISLQEPFPFQLAVTFPEPAGGRVAVRGELGPPNLSLPRNTPVRAKVKLENFHPRAVSSFLSVPVELARLGSYDGELDVTTSAQEWSLAGNLELRSRNGKSEDAVRVETERATLAANFSRIQLGKTTLRHAGANLHTEGTVELGKIPQFNLSLNTDNADLGALARLPARLGFPLPLALPPLSGTVTTLLKAKGAPSEFELTGAAQLNHLAVQLEGFGQPLRVPTLELTFEPNRIIAAPFELSPEPGLKLTLAGELADYKRKPRLQAQIGGGEVPVGPLLALAVRFGQNPLGGGQQLSGRVRPDLRIAGPLSELTYEGTLHFRDLTLATPQLPQTLRVASAELQLTPSRLSASPFTAEVGDQLRAQVGFHLDQYAPTRTAPAKPTLAARIETQNADLGALLGLVRVMGPDPLPGSKASGRVSATIDVAGRLGEKAPPLAYSGKAQLAEASLQPAGMREPLGIRRAQLDFGLSHLEVTNLELEAAGMKAQGSVRIEEFDRPRVRFDLRGDHLDLDALQAMFAETRPATGTAPSSARASPRVVFAAAKREAGWFSRLSGRGTINFARVTSGSFALAPVSAPVAVAKGILTCDPIEFGLYEGGGRGRLELDLNGAEPVTEFNGLLRNVDVNRLLSAMSDSKDRLHGRLGGRLEVWFAGGDRPRITQSARGQGEVTLVGGRLARMNLSRELGAVAQFAGLRFEQADTPIEDLSTRFEIAEGWVRTQELTLRTPDLALQAAGGFSLTDELAFESTAIFTPEASQRISSQGSLGGLAGGFFTDEQGRVVIPFRIRGTFAQPKLSLDAARLAEMQLKRGLGAQPGSALGDLLDRIRKRKPQTEPQPQPQE
jgi:uncharacterized protein involved in outer membrane biogenesis